MTVEKDFVTSLISSIHAKWSGAYVIRSSDRFTLGVPDILAWCPMGEWPHAIAIEAKQLTPLMRDPFHRGRRTGDMLKHPFMGPQISTLRKMKRAGVDARGIVRASEDTAFMFDPDLLPAKTGNFTHTWMLQYGVALKREGGAWRL